MVQIKALQQEQIGVIKERPGQQRDLVQTSGGTVALILSELEDFELKRHDHEHRGGMSLKDHSGSYVQMEMN